MGRLYQEIELDICSDICQVYSPNSLSLNSVRTIISNVD